MAATACGALLGATESPASARRPLREVAGFYGFPRVTVTDDRLTCRSAYTTLVFEADSRRMTVNGYRVFLNGAVDRPREAWRMHAVDADTVLDALLRPSRVLPQQRVRVVMLDPGHGGTDLGAVGARNVQEKRVVFDIARRVRVKLHSEPYQVLLTREGDQTVSLADRVQRANADGADLFVSIHINAARDTAVNGVETFILPAAGYPATAQSELREGDEMTLPGNRFDAANTLLGYLLHKELVDAARIPDRGLKRARFAVLKTIECPAVLIECGFVSNPREEERFLRPEHRDRLAEAIAGGIRAYVDRNRCRR